MARFGLILPDELAGFSTTDTIEVAKAADAAGVHSIWKGETSGSNGVAVLSAIAEATDSVRLGTGIANVYSRSPTLLGMTAVTLDDLSDGRVLFGIGTSSPPLVEEWHGLDYDRPLANVREALDIVRDVVAGGDVDHDGGLYDVGPYAMKLSGPRDRIPIYNAANGPANRQLTARHADGWTPILTPLSLLSERIDDLEETAHAAGRDPADVTVAPWVPASVSNDPDLAEARVRSILAQELAMGYYELFRGHRFEERAERVADEWTDGSRESAADLLSEEMLAELTIHGGPAECLDAIESYREAGADVPLLWPSFDTTPAEVETMIEELA